MTSIKVYITVFLTVIFFTANAQSNYYYYYKGEKVNLTLDKSKINIVTNNSFSTIETSNLGFKNYSLENDVHISENKIGKLEYVNEPSSIEFYQKLNTLKNKSNIKSVGLFFERLGTTSLGTSNYFYVKLKSENDLPLLQQYSLQKSVQIIKQVPYMPLWYILSTTNTQFTSLELSNQYYESNLFSDTDPAFMFNFQTNCTNDTDFGSLWGLNNSLNSSIDINACDAWTITEGSGVNVAVIDTGIQLDHDDLDTNIASISYDCQTQTSPSILRPQFPWFDHGTHVAGTIGAIKDNNFQIVGVSPQSNLLSISHSLSFTQNISAELASGFSWAVQNGADIINNSWGDPDPNGSNLGSPILENAIVNALNNGRNGQGSIVVFATGNENGGLRYPASTISDILAVGSITSSGSRSSFSNFGSLLDIVAPGSNILSTVPYDSTTPKNGTSMASPHAAGVAALVLSVNPCLSGQQVRDIIEQTSQKVGGYSYTTNSSRPNGTWNDQMGYGLIDAYAAVQMAQSMGSATLDLYVKDSPNDDGTEPNSVTQHMWTSQDIWVRNNNDGGLTHQNPEYRSNGNPNFINIRVINKSCVTSTGNETLTLNWAKANTALAWPQNWDGSLQNSTGFDLGGELNSVTIPSLQEGEEVIVIIPWVVPNPDDYIIGQGSDNPWHFCLLARIDSPDDPMSTFTSNPNDMVRNNNNQAWKNITVVDLVADRSSASVMVANPSDTPRTFFLELQKQDNEGGKAIFEEAEVTLKMDVVLFDAWERGGKIAQELDSTVEEKRKLVKGDNVILDDIAFEANEMGLLTIDFNFLTKELTDKSEYTYHVVQKDANTGEVIGGETYVIKKDTRPAFIADAGDDKEVDLNETITISAEDINEPALYNWYDKDGNLIYQGKDLTVTADVVKEYKLEVIATTDGFKDYADVEVKFKPNVIESISPNPVSNNLTVNYKINDASSSYLMVIGYYGSNTSNNYILDASLQQTQINVSSYPMGYYTVALVCNGEIVDAKTLIKQ